MHVRPISIPRSTSPHAQRLPRHSNTDALDCVHTSPCIPWRAHTWHAGTRAHTATPTPAPRPRHLPRPLPQRRRRAVAASAPPQHARQRRQSASWCPRPGEQACGQRRGHSDKSGLGRRRRSPAQGTLHSGHAPAQAHCSRGSHGRPRLCRSGQDKVQTHVVFFIHVSALLDQVRHQVDHALPSRIKERMLGSVLAQRCLDLLLLDLITAAFGPVQSGFAVLKRAGVSAGAWRGRACMCGPSPSLALPCRTLLPRHSHTDAHDCVHTSPCIPWRAHTWHAGTRARGTYLVRRRDVGAVL
jgi:hypothetical protein